MPPITAGQTVRIKPQWQDPGDDQIIWIAVDNEEKGRVTIQAQLGEPINPTQIVQVDWISPVSSS